MNTLAAQISAIWRIRNAGEVENARDAYLDLLAERNVPSDRVSAAELFQKLCEKGVAEEDALELLLLNVSFLRNKRIVGEAKERLEFIASKMIRPNYSLLLQRGLNSFAESKPSDGLESFLEAKRLAAEKPERLVASFNAILAMEDLGLEIGGALEKFLTEFSGSENEAWATAINGQLTALRLRAALRGSDFSALDALTRQSSQGEQALYFAAWAAEIPFTKLAARRKELRERFTARVAENGITYLSSYRMRTLSGLFVEEDLSETIRTAEQVERVYLWVWRWLLTPDANLLSRVLKVAENLYRHLTNGSSLSFEEYGMAANSLRWLGLFSGVTKSEMETALEPLAHSEGRAVSHLDCESRILDYLFTLRASGKFLADARASLLEHAFLCPNGLMRSLFENPGEEYAELGASIRSLENAEDSAAQNGIRLEFLKRRIHVTVENRKESLQSESLAKLLQLFLETDRSKKEQVVRNVFGLVRFDAGVHDPKLANLLSKANSLLRPFAAFSTKGDMVIADIVRDSVKILEADAHSLSFTRTGASLGFLRIQATEKQNASVNLTPLLERWASRAEFEAALSVSRATAARILARWVDENHAELRGRGKSVQYRLRSLPQEVIA